MFAKTPLSGHVKTRLAADIGNQAALDVYKQLLEKTLHTVVSSKLSPVELWLDSDNQDIWLQDSINRLAVPVQQQSGIDLGERMASAFEKTLGDADFCVLIGTDCPLLDMSYLSDACAALHSGIEIVIGPAEDGGYVLIGLRNCKPELFASIDWSTSAVMQQTLQTIDDQQWQHKELPVLWDIDRLADWRRWTELPQSKSIA